MCNAMKSRSRPNRVKQLSTLEGLLLPTDRYTPTSMDYEHPFAVPPARPVEVEQFYSIKRQEGAIFNDLRLMTRDYRVEQRSHLIEMTSTFS